MADQVNLIDAIVTDHHEVESMFTELERGVAGPKRRQIVEQAITELVRHSVGEEEYLYPTARKVLPNGDQIADHELREHAQAEEVMKQIEQLRSDDPQFEALVAQLMKDIRHHVHDEENDLLPKLREACDSAELGELGEKFQSAKNIAPTRPHPAAPDHPPADKVLDPAVGLVDRVRDALSGRNG